MRFLAGILTGVLGMVFLSVGAEVLCEKGKNGVFESSDATSPKQNNNSSKEDNSKTT